MQRSPMTRMVAALVVLWGCLASLNPLPASEDANSQSDKQQREARLASMHERAKTIEVQRVAEGNRELVALHDLPVFRYSDQPRGFVDATLWCWGATGRPAAVAKVEMVVDKGKPYWQYCLASTADEPLEVNFGGVRRFTASQPGIEFKSIADANVPQDTPAGRLRQMKELFARFSSTVHSRHVDSDELVKQEMRSLPSPIHRYAGAGVDDGVIFGLTSNGTNPDLLVFIELRSVGDQPKTPHYGIVRMTDAELHVRIDDHEVWNSPYQAPKVTWTSVFLPRTVSK